MCVDPTNLNVQEVKGTGSQFPLLCTGILSNNLGVIPLAGHGQSKCFLLSALVHVRQSYSHVRISYLFVEKKAAKARARGVALDDEDKVEENEEG